MNAFMWILQGLLGLLFLFAGVSKYLMSYEQMSADSPVKMPYWFILFIGACEILGALGLILPWLLGIRRELTPIAAALLALIMGGAVVISAMVSVPSAIFPLVIGLLLLFIAYRRRADLARPDKV